MIQLVIGVGSNIEPDFNIKKAAEFIAADHHLVQQSAFTRTKALNRPDDPDFLNGAFLVETTMTREGFRNYLKKVETDMGRIWTEDVWGPRCIDLDIAVWDGEIVDEDVYSRDFLRNAVKEMLPDLAL